MVCKGRVCVERGGVMERGCGVVGGNVWGVLGGGEERSGVEVEGVEGCVGWWRVCVCGGGRGGEWWWREG